MRQIFFKGKKKQLVIFGILFIMVLVPFNLVGEVTIERDDNVFLTPLDEGWNLVSLRYDATLYKENLTVSFDGNDYSWTDAVSAGIVNNYIYMWNAAQQMYNFAGSTDPSFGYWIFAYEPCQLWGDVNVTVIGIDGGGNPNYLSKFTGSTTIGSSGIYETASGNVGIGTTSPSTLLDVGGTISANGGSSADWNTAYGWGDHAIQNYFDKDTDTSDNILNGADSLIATYDNQTQWEHGEVAFNWGDHSTAGYDMTDDSWTGTDDIYTNSGNVGIGTSTPNVVLDVEVSNGGSATIGDNGVSASGDYAIAMGSDTTASGSKSTAMGTSTIASGSASTAMGAYSIATKQASTALGLMTQANGDYSTSMGYDTCAGGIAATS